MIQNRIHYCLFDRSINLITPTKSVFTWSRLGHGHLWEVITQPTIVLCKALVLVWKGEEQEIVSWNTDAISERFLLSQERRKTWFI